MGVRKFIIRESDLKRMSHYERKKYTKIDFVPITQEWLQKQVSWWTLRGKKSEADAYRHWPYPSELIKRLPRTRLYDRRYKDWLVNYNEQGELQVRAGLNLPVSRLGFALAEVEDKGTTDVSQEH